MEIVEHSGPETLVAADGGMGEGTRPGVGTAAGSVDRATSDGGGDPGQGVLDQLNRILDEHWFDTAMEHLCRCSTSARWLAEDRELRIPGSGKHGHWIEVFSMFRRGTITRCVAA